MPKGIPSITRDFWACYFWARAEELNFRDPAEKLAHLFLPPVIHRERIKWRGKPNLTGEKLAAGTFAFDGTRIPIEKRQERNEVDGTARSHLIDDNGLVSIISLPPM